MRILRLLEQFHRRQRASAMTEFVICLPMLVFTFIGLNSLHKLGDAYVSASVAASKPLWQAVHDEEESVSRISPMGGIDDHFRIGLVAAPLYQGIDGVLPGHFNKSSGFTHPGMRNVTGQSYRGANIPAGQRLVNNYVTADAREVTGSEPFVTLLINDSISTAQATDTVSSIFNGGFSLDSLLSLGLAAVGGMEGIIGGTRYGAVEAGSSRTVETPFLERTYNISYTSRISPNPHYMDDLFDFGWITIEPETVAWASVWIAAQQNDAYSGLPDLQHWTLDPDGMAYESPPGAYKE